VRRDLVEAAQRGDHEAFEVLATSVADRLYAAARLILRDADRAEDAVQEALVHAWQQLPTLRDPDRFGGWVHRLLVNACADEGRRMGRWSREIKVIRMEPSASDDTAGIADRDLLERGFRRLKPEQRAVLVLHFYVGLPARDIAAALGIPEGTAKSRLHYATEAMRAAVEADDRSASVARNGTTA
jgi:RNA polymerase sigma-70 factor (ECF subfamily)